MDLITLALRIENRMKMPLPGRIAQLKMSSMGRIQELMRHVQPQDPVRSGVLILLYPYQEEIGIVLIQRPDYDGIHSGQISLPGGKYEKEDESIIRTALREAKEEVGIDGEDVQILGRITDMYIPPSNFLVSPVVGSISQPPEFNADPNEVASIIEIRLSDLLDDGNIRKKQINLRFGIKLTVPAFFINEKVIWGATAMILSEFREIVLEVQRG